MAWIESHQELETHPKLLRLCNLLQVKQPQAIGHLMCLWWWSLKYAEDGVLDRFDVADLLLACRYEGSEQVFIEAMTKSGFLDQNPLKIHDWVRYAGQWLRNKYASSNKQWLLKTWRIYGLKYGDKKATDKQVLRNKKATLTKPNLTKPNLSLISGPPATEKPRQLTPVQKVVLVYKMATGYEKDDKSWDQLNFARCSKSAKALIDFLGDWEKAADCVQDVYERLTSKGLTVTLETVTKHAADWKKDMSEREAKRGVPIGASA